jgi:TP901 family phage tail tape measure protein
MANKVGSLYFTLGVDATEFENKLNGASARLADFGKKAQDVGRQMSMSLTLPLAAIGGASAKMAMDFEASMAQIEGLVGIGSEEVRQMGVTAREMAKEMGKSANEAAQGLYFITSAGVKGAAAMDTLEMSLKASAVGLGETQVIADLVTSALNAYGAANITAAEATDVMVAAVREGKIEADQLAGSMGRVLPIASSMGVQFNEVGATFAALSRTGTDAAEAATQLRGILSALLNPEEKARKELERLDLSAQGIRDTIKNDGLLAALEMLTQKFEGNDEAAGIVFGNVRALSGVLDLFGANVDVTRQIFENMTDSTGALSAAFAVTEQTAKFKLNKAIEDAKFGMIELGNAILQSAIPMIERLGAAVGALGQWFSELSPTMKSVIVATGAITAALGPLTIGLGLAATGLSAVITVVKALTIALATNPFGLIAVALAATVAAFATAYAKSEVFRESLSRLFTVFGTIANSIGSILNSIFGPVLRLIGLSSEFGVTWSNMLGIFVGVLNTIQGRLIGLAGVVSGVIRSIDLAFQGEFKKSGHALAQAMQSGLDAVNPGKMAQDFVDAYNSVIGKADISVPDPTQSFRGSGVYKAMAQGATEATNATKKLTEEQIKLRQEEEKRQAAIKGQLQNVVGLKSLTALTADLTETMGKAPTGFFANLFGDVEGPISNIEKVKNKLLELYTPMGQLMAEFSKIQEQDPLQGMADKITMQIDPSKTAVQSLFDSMAGNEEKAVLMAQAVSQAFDSMSQNLLGSLTNSENGFMRFVGGLGQTILKLISMLLSQSIAYAITGGSSSGAATGPAAVFTTPAFIATAVAGVLGAFAAIPKFAKGGAVTGPTLAMVGENPASRGEAIIPFERMGSFLSQFTGMGGGGVQQVVVTGQIAGDTIRLSNQKSGINNGRVRWERGTGRALVN